MKLDHKLSKKLFQGLSINHSLKQCIDMLRLSTLELSEFLSEELLNNPVLEEDFNQGEYSVPAATLRTVSNNGEADENAIGMIPRKETLAEHLLGQARLEAMNDYDFDIYETVITSLNKDGFFLADPLELASYLNVEPDVINFIIKNIQTFDPVGCATTGVKECIARQAVHRFPNDRILHKMAAECLDDIASMRYEKISSFLNIPVVEVIMRKKKIEKLNPYPGADFNDDQPGAIMVDLNADISGGDVLITMNDDWLPHISINPFYFSLLSRDKIDRNVKEFVRDKIDNGRNLIRNILTRRMTIASVAREILQYQADFLLNGPGHLRHMTGRMIAEKTGFHESTVSRVAGNKYVQTKQGIFSLRHFFVSGLGQADADNSHLHSSDEAKMMIKSIIEGEVGIHAYSDDEIAEKLSERGVEASRRTMTKYRNQLHIPSARIRKKIRMTGH